MLRSSINDFTQGPRYKSSATIEFESLTKDILRAYNAGTFIGASYNPTGELMVKANDHTYNVSQILKHTPDLEQLCFNDDDLSIWDKFLHDDKTVYGFIKQENPDESRFDEEQIKAIQTAFPNLSLAEASAIHNYTEEFYTAMDSLLMYDGINCFPSKDLEYGEISMVYDQFIKKLYPDRDEKHNYEYYLSDPAFFSALVKETVLNISFAASALSKPIQDELHITSFQASEELRDTLHDMSGVSIVLLPKVKATTDDMHSSLQSPENIKYSVCVVAYNRVVNQLQYPIDLIAMLSKHQDKSCDGIKLSIDEYNEIITSISSNSLDKLRATLKSKLIGILLSNSDIAELLYEDIYSVSQFHKSYTPKLLADIRNKLMAKKCFEFSSGFYSASDKVQDAFRGSYGSVITKLKNPILVGKNIQCMAMASAEDERLLIHGQQIAYTALSDERLDEFACLEYDLKGFLIRSIDGIDSFTYSRELVMLREDLLQLPEFTEKKTLIKQVSNLLSKTTRVTDSTGNEKMLALCLSHKVVAFAEILVLYYLKMLIEGSNYTATLFKKHAESQSNLITQIRSIIKTYFGLDLPDSIEKISGSIQIHIPLTSDFCSKTNYPKSEFIFDLSTIKLINDAKGSFSLMVMTVLLDMPSEDAERALSKVPAA